MRKVVFFAGLAVLISSLVIFNVAITPSDKANIRLLSQISQTPLGQSIMSLSTELLVAGQQIVILSYLLALELPLYFFGGGMMLLGVFLRKVEDREGQKNLKVLNSKFLTSRRERSRQLCQLQPKVLHVPVAQLLSFQIAL